MEHQDKNSMEKRSLNKIIIIFWGWNSLWGYVWLLIYFGMFTKSYQDTELENTLGCRQSIEMKMNYSLSGRKILWTHIQYSSFRNIIYQGRDLPAYWWEDHDLNRKYEWFIEVRGDWFTLKTSTVVTELRLIRLL